MRMMLSSLLVLCTLSAAGPVVAEETPARVWIEAWADVDAEGRVTGLEFDPGAAPVITGVAEPVLRGLAFEPASRDGQAVASRTRVGAQLAFTPRAEGEYAGTVLRTNEPVVRLASAVNPDYPSATVREGVGGIVLLDVAVKADGRVDAADTRLHSARFFRRGKDYDGPLGRLLVDATLAAVTKWRYDVPQVDGQPIAVRLRVPTRYTPPRVDMTAWFDALGDDGASASPQDERVRLPRRKTPAVEPER